MNKYSIIILTALAALAIGLVGNVAFATVRTPIIVDSNTPTKYLMELPLNVTGTLNVTQTSTFITVTSSQICLGGTCDTTWPAGGSGGVATTSVFSAGYVPVISSSLALANSVMYQSGSNIGIGTTTPAQQLHVYSGTTGVYVRAQGAGDGSNFSCFELWSLAANYWQLCNSQQDGGGNFEVVNHTVANGFVFPILIASGTDNVGIHTKFPTSTLSVVGTMFQSGGVAEQASTTVDGNITSTSLTVTNTATISSGTYVNGLVNVTSTLNVAATSTLLGNTSVGTTTFKNSSTSFQTYGAANTLTASSAVTVFIGDASSSRPGCIAFSMYPTGTQWGYLWLTMLSGSLVQVATTTPCP